MVRAERLWRRGLERTVEARRQGALIPLRTERIPPAGWEPFELRRLLTATPKHLRAGGPRPNPFLPWDRELEVERLGTSHLVLLNKYPVQRGHLLLLTQGWAPQNGWLEPADWRAVEQVNADTGGLWFFNSCAEAGASQPHRHLQLLPRHTGEPPCPLASRLAAQLEGATPRWPWAYRLSRRDPGLGPGELDALYRRHARELGLGCREQRGRPCHPYNLLFCDDWFLTVRRHREHRAGFSVNALGFAGYLLLTDRADLDWFERHGPWDLLAAVAVPDGSGSGPDQP